MAKPSLPLEHLTEDRCTRVEQALKEAREALRAKDAEQAAAKAEILDKGVREAGTSVYAQGQTGESISEAHSPPEVPQGGEARPSGAGPQSRVMDAQYRESGPH